MGKVNFERATLHAQNNICIDKAISFAAIHCTTLKRATHTNHTLPMACSKSGEIRWASLAHSCSSTFLVDCS